MGGRLRGWDSSEALTTAPGAAGHPNAGSTARRGLPHRSLVVLELHLGLVPEADEEIEREVPVGSPHERERGSPTMHGAIQSQDVLAELLLRDVVVGVPRNGPSGRERESDLKTEVA